AFRLAGMWHADTAGAQHPLGVVPDTVCSSGDASHSCDMITNTLTVVYSGCTTLTAAGHTVVRSGTVSEQVTDANFCSRGTIPPAATVTLTLAGFGLIETDAAGTELARVSADISDVFVPSGGGCAGALSGTETVDGTQHVRCVRDAQTVNCPP